MGKHVLVTGASGFIAQQLILDLLAAGHQVRGTVRSLAKADALKQVLGEHGANLDALELVEADLESDSGWAEAMAGIDVLQHVASPFPMGQPKDPQVLIRPAVEGTLRVLKAARAAGVTRVIVTSSAAAIAYGWGDARPEVMTEEHWSNPDNTDDIAAYPQSKTLAERAAWDYANAEGLQLTTINPVGVFGPIMSAQVKTSVGIVAQLMNGDYPALPNAGVQGVDVRDVSAAHIAAMDNEDTIGERYILADEFVTLMDVANVLREAFPEFSKKIPTRSLPDFVVKFLALFMADMKTISNELGRRRFVSSAKVRKMLGRELIPCRDALIASGETLKKYGAVKP